MFPSSAVNPREVSIAGQQLRVMISIARQQSEPISVWLLRKNITISFEDERITADTDGKLLCDGGLQLLRPDGSRMLAFPQSVRIYTLSKLVDCVLRYVKWLSFSSRNRSVKFVPISIDLSDGS